MHVLHLRLACGLGCVLSITLAGGVRAEDTMPLANPPPALRRLPAVAETNPATAVSAEETRAAELPPPTADSSLAAPLEEAIDEVLSDTTDAWFWPHHWIDADEWDGGAEVGFTGASGNVETMTMRVGANLKRKTKVYEIGGDLTYLKTASEGIESQHRLLSNSGYERFFGETRWSYYIKTFFEYDEFKAFDVRLILSSGVGYQLIRAERTRLKARFGAGTSREFGGPDDEWIPEAAFGADYEWTISERQKLGAVTDFYPAWTDFHDYRLVTTASWEFLLDKEDNLSLKVSLSDRYDSTPNGRLPNDFDYGLLLLWKI